MHWAVESLSPSWTAHRPTLSCSCRRCRSCAGVDHSWTLVGRGGRWTAISRPSGPLKVRLSMSKSLGSPVQEECLGEKLAPHDAAEVQEGTTFPLARRELGRLILGDCSSGCCSLHLLWQDSELQARLICSNCLVSSHAHRRRYTISGRGGTGESSPPGK